MLEKRQVNRKATLSRAAPVMRSSPGRRGGPEPPIKGAGPIIVGQRPDGDAPGAAVAQIVAHGPEQARAEAKPLIFGREVKLIDLALRRDGAVAAAAVGRIAGDRLADIEHDERASAADGREPPARAASGDHLAQGEGGNDALIRFTPSRIEHAR